MASYAVDPGQLESVDVLLADCAVQARAALGRLRTAADALLDARWRGPAATDFRQGWAEWHDGAQAMLAALAELSRAVRASGRAYDTTEAAVQSAMARTSA